MTRARIGFVANPVAGLGGPLGLHGSDDMTRMSRSSERNWSAVIATGPARHRARRALSTLAQRGDDVHLVTAGGNMGARLAAEERLSYATVYDPDASPTTPGDTARAARAIVDSGVDVLMFVGGDGTARDICDSAGPDTPVVGVPAGVKMHSGVFAFTPEDAARAAIAVALSRAPTDFADVVDLDEAARERGDLTTRIYGRMLTPVMPEIQHGKSRPPSESDSVAGMADELRTRLRGDCCHVFGPGTTVQGIGAKLGHRLSLLGVDVHCAGRLAVDIASSELDAVVAGRPVQIVVSPIGGQGVVLGRGNQQIGPALLERLPPEDLIIVCSPRKLAGLAGRLRLDTASPDLNARFAGPRRVITGRGETAIVELR